MDYKKILEIFNKQKDSKWNKKAEKYYNSPKETEGLLTKAEKKAEDNHKGPLKEIWGKFVLLTSMIKDWSKGNYREVSKSSMILALAGIVYFVSPLDIVPDFLVGLGFFDDAAILGFIIKQINNEITKYNQWKKGINDGGSIRQ